MTWVYFSVVDRHDPGASNRPEGIGATLQQMGRESVAERVGRQPAAGRQQPSYSFDQALDISCIQTVAAEADEYGTPCRLSLNGSRLIPGRKVIRQCPRGKFTERDDSFFLSFPRTRTSRWDMSRFSSFSPTSSRTRRPLA